MKDGTLEAFFEAKQKMFLTEDALVYVVTA
jgi:hypothetical protein